uniref:MAGE family member B10 n=1 Tax=Neovison vison TaxID=452646 RepID=A0A8C7EIZ9_NEOVI
MPRGQKSKLRAREKRRQAREESGHLVDAQATEPEKEKPSSSPSPHFKDAPQSSPATGAHSNPQITGGVHSTSTTAEAAPNTRFNEGAKNQVEEKPNASQAKDTTEHWPRGPIDKKVAINKGKPEAARSQNDSPGSEMRETHLPQTEGPPQTVSYMRSNEGTNEVQGRPRSSQNPTATEPFHRSPLGEKVFILVYYLLYKYQTKEPITKADMLRNVIQIYRNYFHVILRKASDHLELVFGLDMKEVDPNRHIYVLVNKLEPSYDGRLSNESSVPETGLLMTVLGVIFTKGNCATEEQVWEVLNMMGLYPGRKHFIYGEPRKLITRDLVKENYLEYRQVVNSDPPRFEFLWGPRAHAETSKMRVLEFLAKIHDTIPSAFPSYYEEALRDEEELKDGQILHFLFTFSLFKTK